ncbi:MAG: hypothetical protein JWL83_2462, partial [Actinomycetia bacterium]|nr:hypothetical protein [Actinomycetes bacterium]
MALNQQARSVRCAAALDVGLTFGPLVRGAYDPASRISGHVWTRAWHTPQGAVTTRIEAMPRDSAVEFEAWGPGAAWALHHAPEIVGAGDGKPVFAPTHPLLGRLARRFTGLRFARLRAVYDVAIATVLEQRVTSIESRRTWSALVRAYGEPAPGPYRLRLAPSPDALAALSDHARHELGIEWRRGVTLARIAAQIAVLDRAAAEPGEALHLRLRAMPGIGPWTTAHIVHAVQGDPDAVPVGDWHLPSHVAWALRGERRADDARMLELLEPFRPQRAWAWRLIMAGVPMAPRRVPRAR